MSLVVGPFRLDTDNDAWSRQSFFSRDVDTVADLTLADTTVSAGPSFGNVSVKFTASAQATHQVELVWPDDEHAVKKLQAFGIDVSPSEVGVRVRLHGSAEAKASARLPAGPLKIGIGVAGGGSVTYQHFKTYPVTAPIADVLDETIRSLRLPLQATTPATLPANGELITTTLDGYLELSADVAWGATLSNARGVNLADLDLEFASKVAVAATAAARYRLAGRFDVSCCRAGDGLRIVVHKSRESQFSFAADFSMVADFATKGLPNTADQFLAKLLGADADRVLRALDRAQQFDSIEKLQAAAGTWASDALLDLAQPLIGKSLNLLDTNEVKQFLAAVREVTGQYTSLDERVARIYQDAIDDVPRLTRALDLLASASSPDALKNVHDSAAWELFRTMAGDRLYDALLLPDEYKQILDVVERAREFVASGPEKVKSVVATLQARLAIDPLIRRLNALSSPDQLRALVQGQTDAQVRKLVSLLLEKPFERLEHFNDELQRLQQAIRALDTFKDKWYGQLLKTANSSFKATVNAEFSRATEDDALLDVEIDVSTPRGEALAARAALGDFAEVLANAAQPLVKLRDAVLTHRVTRQSSLRVSVLGFELKQLSRLVTATDDRFQQTDAGLLLVHTFEVTSEEQRRIRNEQTITRFLLRGAAEGLVENGDRTRVHMVDMLGSLSAAYEFSIEDSKTSVAELLEYLGFAESVGLLQDRSQFVTDLQRELPGGWTSIKAEYVVRYDSAGVSAVFARPTKELIDAATPHLRRLIGRVLVVAGQPRDAELGLAFQDGHTRQAFAAARPSVPSQVAVTLPAWVTRDKPQVRALTREQKLLLDGLFLLEANYLERFRRLDTALDAIRVEAGGDSRKVRTLIKTKDLDSIATDFVAFAGRFPRDKKVNPFFGTFDALVLEAAPKHRKAALVLEITPTDGAGKVTKYLSA
jgi:hypothetical protein